MRTSLPRLRDERHHRARHPRRARRAEAGSPAHPLLRLRAGPRAHGGATARARRSSATCSASTTRTATRAVYDAMVRLAQDFSMRYPLIDGQGNYGSVDGDPAAAYRYTEARLTRDRRSSSSRTSTRSASTSSPNFDDRLKEPTVLPARVPNLLVNGTGGIAVGMATNIPPHNLGEVVDATIHLMRNPDATDRRHDALRPRPRLPHRRASSTGAAGIEQAHRTGRGSIIMRARIDRREVARARRTRADRRHRDPLPGEQGARRTRSIARARCARRSSRASARCATRATATACASSSS